MPPNQLNEQELQFKKRARRRLVGAIALVLLMVTVLPMVLDDRAEKTTQQQEIAITIPSQDGTDFTSKVVPVVPPEPLPESNLENVPAETAAPIKLAEEIAEIPEKPVAEATNPVAVAKEAAKPAIEPGGNSNTFTVQIGVFSDMANVRKLQQKLLSLGYKSQTEKLTTPKGDKIRLRTAPFATRALAEEALAAIKSSGLSGMVVLNKQDS